MSNSTKRRSTKGKKLRTPCTRAQLRWRRVKRICRRWWKWLGDDRNESAVYIRIMRLKSLSVILMILLATLVWDFVALTRHFR